MREGEERGGQGGMKSVEIGGREGGEKREKRDAKIGKRGRTENGEGKESITENMGKYRGGFTLI